LPGDPTRLRQVQSPVGDAAHPLAGTTDDASAQNRPAGPPLGWAQTKLEQARAEASAWKSRARESEHAREEIARRMDAARRAVYDANLRLEQAEMRAEQAEARARDAEAQAGEAEARAEQADARARQADAATDALMSSTTWRATGFLRTAGNYMPTALRRAFRGGTKFARRG